MTADHHDTGRFIDRARELAGLADADAARHVVRAVLSVPFEQLSVRDRAWLAHTLPPGLAESATSVQLRLADDPHTFYERVGMREGCEPGFAMEHTRSVCRVLVETLDDDQFRNLIRRLPDALVDLFAVPDPPRAPPTPAPHLRPRWSRRSLAEAQPASGRTLSEAEPQRAQQDSVARSDNPHADSKLSSSRGTT